ncbi:VAMP-associated protein [Gonapodya prolifera JEL478]|uniref:VAMP-associated protein n=1 Tax=Gonapodya prolifera (strain JEL478) TaxID=1344416 RepID=A0A139AVW4_GONPJ|nr:VAMP-associated protein [Gonapodya prolifera JEL478]|eukprot:KXS20849.1 VAMP-associated protein [Gonapodya prolifera JEL478]
MADSESPSVLLALEPEEKLEFKRPFQSTGKQSLKVTNTSSDPIAFKVKTTAPKQYCVRPNAGRIAPGESTLVEVLLQPMKEDPPADFKCKDKFLVQGIKITEELLHVEQSDEVTARLQDVWSEAEARKKTDPQFAAANLAEKKLRVVFTGDVAAPARSPPPLPSNDATVGETAPTQPYPASTPANGSINSASPPPPSAPAPIPAAVLTSLPREDLERQLAEAQQAVRKLQAANETLKQTWASGPTSSKSKKGSQATAMAKKEGDAGFDMKFAGIIALIAFILGYWFKG